MNHLNSIIHSDDTNIHILHEDPFHSHDTSNTDNTDNTGNTGNPGNIGDDPHNRWANPGIHFPTEPAYDPHDDHPWLLNHSSTNVDFNNQGLENQVSNDLELSNHHLDLNDQNGNNGENHDQTDDNTNEDEFSGFRPFPIPIDPNSPWNIRLN